MKKTFGEIKRELQELGCKNVAYGDNGLLFDINEQTYLLTYEGYPVGVVLVWEYDFKTNKKSYGFDFNKLYNDIKNMIRGE